MQAAEDRQTLKATAMSQLYAPELVVVGVAEAQHGNPLLSQQIGWMRALADKAIEAAAVKSGRAEVEKLMTAEAVSKVSECTNRNTHSSALFGGSPFPVVEHTTITRLATSKPACRKQKAHPTEDDASISAQ